ncbi:hypothetical protein [Marinobacter litoralis]|uniref:hypothetical protein n=1 Tax=Marinobacter litoralis TaxID=187981 RepID=UPI0018EA9338|nr:hypothetical protein [Marinobacter litoralis]MBJ6137862.1 hypothetical protein [Marinobacter litoralis]
MLRVLGVSGFLIAVIGIAFWALQHADDTGEDVARPECDLLAGPCSWTTPEGQWQVSLKPQLVSMGAHRYELVVETPSAPDRFLAVLRGRSMYMGEYPVPLQRQSSTQFRAEFDAPLCATGSEMVWQVDLQSGQQPLGTESPVLYFQAKM